MRAMRIGWRLLISLVTVLVAGRVLEAGNDRFQSIVLVVLVCIYAQIRTSFAGLGMALQLVATQAVSQFTQLAALLKDPAVERYREDLAAGGTAKDRQQTFIIIEIGTATIMWFMALWRLFVVL